MADIRNLRNPFDKKRKEDAFFRTLRLQAKLAQQYNEAVEEKGDSQKLGITPVAPKARDPMEEQQDISAQRAIAVENLRTVATPDVADKIVQQLIAIGDASDLYYINTNWERLKQAIGGRKNITDTYFRALLQRFRQQQQETTETDPDTGEVVETGLAPTAREGLNELRDEFDRLTNNQARNLFLLLRDMNVNMQNRLMTGLASIAPQIQTQGQLVKLIADTTGEDEGNVASKLGFDPANPTTPLKSGTRPRVEFEAPPSAPAFDVPSEKFNVDQINAMTTEAELSAIDFDSQVQKVLSAIGRRIEEIHNPGRGPKSAYVKVKGFSNQGKEKMIQLLKDYFKTSAPPRGGAEEPRGGAEESKEPPKTTFTPNQETITKEGEPSIRKGLKVVALLESDRLDDINPKHLQEALDYASFLGILKDKEEADISNILTRNMVVDGLKDKYLERYDNMREATEPTSAEYYADITKGILGTRGSGIHTKTKAPKFHRKGYSTIMLPREGNRRIVGRGVEAKPKPRYAQFGKFIIHLPSLNKGILNLKYTSLSNIVNIPQQSISTSLMNFIHDLLDSGTVNKDLYYKLHTSDQRLFTKIAGIAEIDDGMGYRNKFHESEKEELDRFNLVKGIFLAGNNAPEVIKELQGFIRKFLNEGKISKGEGLTLLQEISCIS